MAGDLLEETIKKYNEEWKPKHDAVMAQYDRADDISDQVAWGIFLFDRLIKSLNAGATDNTSGIAPMLHAVQSWYQGSSRALRIIGELQDEGFEVENVEALRQRHRRAGAILEELQDAAKACASIENKTSVSVDKFLDELRS